MNCILALRQTYTRKHNTSSYMLCVSPHGYNVIAEIQLKTRLLFDRWSWSRATTYCFGRVRIASTRSKISQHAYCICVPMHLLFLPIQNIAQCNFPRFSLSLSLLACKGWILTFVCRHDWGERSSQHVIIAMLLPVGLCVVTGRHQTSPGNFGWHLLFCGRALRTVCVVCTAYLNRLFELRAFTFRAALHGRVLVLEGVEKAERNVLPVLNNLLENREMQACPVSP